MNLTLEYESFQDFASKLWPSLSEEGMWVPSDQPAGVGQLVDFDVMLADGFRLFHGTGQVIAVGPGPQAGSDAQGMTLRFSQLDQPSRNLVRKVVSKHIGEGGKLFVLSTPGTKVEVVGEGETPDSSSEKREGGMGPEDLVAPFAGLEPSEAWSDENEPELTSFLRPSSRAADLDEEVAAPEPPVFAPPENAAHESLFEAAIAQVDSDEVAGSEEVAEDPPQPEVRAMDEASDEASDEAPDPLAGTAGLGAEPEDAAESPVAFDPALAETQRIEPGGFSEVGQVEIPLVEDSEAVPPMPSTVVPPAFPQYGAEADESDDEGPSTDEFYPHGTSASTGRVWWPWVLLGGLAVGAGLYAVLQLDTPLSGLLGRGGTEAQASDSNVGADESNPADLAAGAAAADGTALSTGGPPAASDAGATGEPTAEEGLGTDAVASDLAGVATSSEPTEADIGSPAATSEPEGGDASSAAADATREVSTSAETVDETAAVPPLEPVRLQRITWRDVEGDTVIRWALTGPLVQERFETQRVLGGNPRLVLKMLGAEGGVPRDPVAIGSNHVRQLRFGIHNIDGVRRVHSVADLVDESVQMVGQVMIADGAVELRFTRP